MHCRGKVRVRLFEVHVKAMFKSVIFQRFHDDFFQRYFIFGVLVGRRQNARGHLFII